MEKDIKEANIPFIMCPLCKVNAPIITSLKYSQYMPLPIILIKCSCSRYTISLNEISLLYSNKNSLFNLNPKDMQEAKYIQFSNSLNSIQLLIDQIIFYLDISSSKDNNKWYSDNKNTVIEIQKKFNFIFIEISELYLKLKLDSTMKNSINAIDNYQRFTFDSILEYKSTLLIIANDIKNKTKIGFISDMINKIRHIENNFMITNSNSNSIAIENKRNDKHLYYSLGGSKFVVNWKINHYSKSINYPSKHSDSVESICELNNGNIVTCGYDKRIQIWDRIKMTVIKVIEGHTKPVLTVIQLENGLLASGSSDNSIRLWNTENGACIKVLNGHSGNVIKLIQLSNKLLVSCSGDTSIMIWNTDNDTNETLNGHELTVESVAELTKTAEGDIILASCSLDRRILIWNVTNRSIINTLFNGSIMPLICLITLKDGNILSGSQSHMYIWNWQESVLLSTIDKGAYCFIQLPNSMVAIGSNDNCVKIHSYPNMELIMVLNGHSFTIISLALLSDGNIISSSWDRTFKIWE